MSKPKCISNRLAFLNAGMSNEESKVDPIRRGGGATNHTIMTEDVRKLLISLFILVVPTSPWRYRLKDLCAGSGDPEEPCSTKALPGIGGSKQSRKDAISQPATHGTVTMLDTPTAWTATAKDLFQLLDTAQ